MRKVVNNVTELIGGTPIVKLNRLTDESMADVYVKLEYQNPGSSVKDRIALAMIKKAEESNLIKPGDTIVEPTSGNTGIGLAMVSAALGYKAVLVMPDTMSQERHLYHRIVVVQVCHSYRIQSPYFLQCLLNVGSHCVHQLILHQS